MNKTTNVLIVGVGGQGIILASEVLAKVALAAGQDVKQSEVHGMAQRGGSVSSHVRFGDTVYSPTIEKGSANILLSFELLETARWLDYLSPESTTIVNNYQIDPMPVASGKATYPADLKNRLNEQCPDVHLVEGIQMSHSAGSIRTMNVALLGVLSASLDFEEEQWKSVIEKRVPAKTVDMNFKAFQLGRESAARRSR